MPRLLRALVIGLVLVAACGGDGDAPAAAPTTTAAPSTTTAIVAGRPFDVDRREVVVEDTTRSTDAAPDRGLEERPSRTLALLVLAPQGDGPFPVVVFSHGVGATGLAYEPFLTDIAAAGYVVIAPTFPLSSGPGGEIFDYVNQPADIYFALDSILDGADASDDPLHGRVDDEHIALAGHSLGAMTTAGAVFNSCCADSRVDAAIVISGVETPFPDGDYVERPPTPVLFAHGDADRTIAVEGGERLFADATGPAAFLRFLGGSHSGILTDEDGVVLRAAIIAWLDRWLLDDPTGLEALPPLVEGSGQATLTFNGIEP